METKTICPLGAECEQIKNKQLYRCRWYVSVKGKDPLSEKIFDQWDCALAWTPILLVENAMTNRGQTQAIESLRNEAVKGQGQLNKILAQAVRLKLENKT